MTPYYQDDLEALGAVIDILSDENMRMRAENARLRAALAMVDEPCSCPWFVISDGHLDVCTVWAFREAVAQ